MSVLSRLLKIDPLDPWDLTRAEQEGRQQARQAAEAIRRLVPGYADTYLLDTANQVGIRSSRRVRGLAQSTDDDVLNFRKYPDGIARSSWDIDVWPADSYTKPAVDRVSDAYRARHEKMLAGDYFDIRYGCLLPQGAQNLLVAGRCLSASHLAESSLRIQQTCLATGEAAGLAAAWAIRRKVAPHEIAGEELAAALLCARQADAPLQLPN